MKKNNKIMDVNQKIYGSIQLAFEHFNTNLFEGTLPDTLIVLQRSRNILGHYIEDRWTDKNGKFTDEIALNPSYWRDGSLLNIFQTLVHEMCHQWQRYYGSPSRNGYHNSEWADKMESIGLIPSSTGKNEPNSKRTGQKMSDYPANEGRFINESRKLVENNFSILLIDRFPHEQPPCQLKSNIHPVIDKRLQEPISNLFSLSNSNNELETLSKKKKQKRKTSYQCITCSYKVWGKTGLSIVCGECSSELELCS